MSLSTLARDPSRLTRQFKNDLLIFLKSKIKMDENTNNKLNRDPKGKLNDKFPLLIETVENHYHAGFLELIKPDEVNDTIWYDDFHDDRNIRNGETPLHLFLYSSVYEETREEYLARVKIIKQLLEWKADVNALADSTHSPLYLAVDGQNASIIPLLLENGAKFRMPHQTPPPFSILTLAYYLEREKGEDEVPPEIPMVKMFMLRGARPEEFLRFGNPTPSVEMLRFYDSILKARQVTIILIGIHRYKRCPLFLICGRDCISLIARMVYETRGNCVWTDQPIGDE